MMTIGWEFFFVQRCVGSAGMDSQDGSMVAGVKECLSRFGFFHTFMDDGRHSTGAPKSFFSSWEVRTVASRRIPVFSKTSAFGVHLLCAVESLPCPSHLLIPRKKNNLAMTWAESLRGVWLCRPRRERSARVTDGGRRPWCESSDTAAT